MRRQADIDADLTLDWTVWGITPDCFQRGICAFFGLLEEVTKAVCDNSPAVQWRVRVKEGSNDMVPVPGFRPELLVSHDFDAMRDGINALEQEESYPRFFNDAAMRHARTLKQRPELRLTT